MDLHILGLRTTIAAKALAHCIDHLLEVATLLEVDLKQIPQAIGSGSNVTKQSLLLGRRWPGIALRHDAAAQFFAKFARDLIPAWRDDPIAKLRRRSEDGGARKKPQRQSGIFT